MNITGSGTGLRLESELGRLKRANDYPVTGFNYITPRSLELDIVCSSPLWNPCGYTENNTSAAALFHDVGDPSTVKPFAAALSDLARRGVVRSPMPASGPPGGELSPIFGDGRAGQAAAVAG
jgi:hypothetical protein